MGADDFGCQWCESARQPAKVILSAVEPNNYEAQTKNGRLMIRDKSGVMDAGMHQIESEHASVKGNVASEIRPTA